MATITVPAETPRKQVVVGGTPQTSFTFDFVIYDVTTDIRLFNGATELTIGSDFTVSGTAGTDGGFDGGTVTMAGSFSSGLSNVTVTILSKIAIKRTSNLASTGPLDIDLLNKDLNRTVSMLQKFEERQDRMPALEEETSITLPIAFPAPSASKIISWNSGATALEATTGRVTSVSVSNVAVSSGASQAATVSFNTTSGALALGIPVGSTGATGASGSAEGTLTTRGDILVRNASEVVRLGIGAANRVLISDGTDPAYGQVPLATAVSGQLPLANGGTGATSLAGANIVVTNAQQTFTKAQVPSTSTAALSASSGVLDFDSFTNFIITLASGSNTLAAPTTEASQIGQCGVIIFIQPSSSSAGTLSLHGDYETAGAAGITLSTANSAVDVVPYCVLADNRLLLGAPQLAFG